MVSEERRDAFLSKMEALETTKTALHARSVTPQEAKRHGISMTQDGRRRDGFDLLGLKDVSFGTLRRIWPEFEKLPVAAVEQVKIDATYARYADRQNADADLIERAGATRIGPDMCFEEVSGLSSELSAKLTRERPETLREASRIEGMTPAALLVLYAHVKSPLKKAS
ncbi:MAG: tRNA uridine-5-carboxymethylaminomethyl(34) synthesis enzyme MnmG, partial [Pseudomonadota bacterium]